MRKFDYHWMDHDEWYRYNENGFYELKPDAPTEARESYQHYLEQVQSAQEDAQKNGYMD